MACVRRTLASNLTHFSRRLHPSFSHLLLDDRDSFPPPCPCPSPALSRSISSFLGSPRRDPKTLLGFSHLPLGLDPCLLRSYSSTPDGSSEIESIKDVAEVLSDAAVAVATSSPPAPFAGEVAAAAADSFVPVAALQYLIDGVHSFTGLNWWACIALTTLMIRGATIPLLLNQMKATVKLNTMRPELEELKQDMQNSMDPQSIQEGQKRMNALFKKHGVTPFTPLKGLFIQGPIFMSFFFAISNMVEKVPSFKGGGAFWFTDLTIPDELYIFPVLTSLTFLATVELNMQEGMEGNPMVKTMKNFSRGIGLLTVPFTASFPKAIFCYWITSNIFSLAYGLVIKRPPVRKFLNLPEIVPQPTPAHQPSFSFFGTPKSITPSASPLSANAPEHSKPQERRVSTSSVISQRIRNLEKTVKSRNKPKKRSLGWEEGRDRSVAIALGSWFYKAIKPPPPKICRSDGGPPVTATRIRLKDGRFLAYSESGVPKEKARFKIVFSHGFSGSRLDTLRTSPELIEELSVYMVGFDRAGYGESDPNRKRSLRSAVSDVEELADALELGPKFYLVGISLGCHVAWASIKYIPQRLLGVAMLAPVINYRWPGFPKDLASEEYNKQDIGDQRSSSVSYYAPALLHWYMEQSLLPTSTAVKGTTYLPNKLDEEIRTRTRANGASQKRRESATQQGIYESLYRDMKVMFGKWEFDPMELPQPSCGVHVYQGDEDGLVGLQRYICSRLNWVNFHELLGTGHYLTSVPGLGDKVLKNLLVLNSSL